MSGLKNTLKEFWAIDTATAASLLLPGPLLLFVFCLGRWPCSTSAELVRRKEPPKGGDHNTWSFAITALMFSVIQVSAYWPHITNQHVIQISLCVCELVLRHASVSGTNKIPVTSQQGEEQM